MADWLDEIEAQADDTSPYYLPRLIAEIRTLRKVISDIAKILSSAECCEQYLCGPPESYRCVVCQLKVLMSKPQPEAPTHDFKIAQAGKD